jgi:hypothetical protein
MVVNHASFHGTGKRDGDLRFKLLSLSPQKIVYG